MNKELIAKQKKLLGLIFGTWALLLVNSWIFELLNDSNLIGYGVRNVEGTTISVFALTIFQMWAIYKYFLKK